MHDAVNNAVHSKTWAIVGASNDRSKFGNRIYRDLRSAGYDVFPVNPNAETVEGDPAFSRVQDVPADLDVVDVVVPAQIGFTIVDDAIEAGARFFWLQPGAESEELIEAASVAGLTVIHHRCAMVEKIDWTASSDGNS